jgi:hypothetical protein
MAGASEGAEHVHVAARRVIRRRRSTDRHRCPPALQLTCRQPFSHLDKLPTANGCGRYSRAVQLPQCGAQKDKAVAVSDGIFADVSRRAVRINQCGGGCCCRCYVPRRRPSVPMRAAPAISPGGPSSSATNAAPPSLFALSMFSV